MAWRRVLPGLCLLLAGFVPGGAASGPEDVLDATWSLTMPLSEGDLQAGDAAGCAGGTLDLADAPNRWSFAEPSLLPGCAEAVLDLAVPEGADRVEVTFRVDRRVTAPAGLSAPTSFVQEVRLVAGGEVQGSLPLWDPASGSHATTDVRAGFPLTGDDVSLVWHFAEAGPAEAASTVRDLQVRIDGLPLDVAVAEAGQFLRAGTDGDEVVDVLSVSFDLPDGADGATVMVRTPWRLSSLTGPSGVLPLDRADLVQEGGLSSLSLPGAGPGAYTLQFQDARAAPIPPGPTTLYPLVWLLFALPAPAAALATHGAARFWHHAAARHHRAAVRLWVQAGLLGAWYVGLLAVMALRLDELATVPFSGLAWSLYAQVGLVLVALLATWAFGARGQLRTVRAHERELEATNRELERSNEELGRFAHVASHDLKEPLRSVQVNTERLARKYGDRLDDSARRSIDHAVAGARRMRSLVDGLLAFSSVGARETPPTPVDVERLLSEVLDGLSALQGETGAEVTHDPLPTVEGHAHLLRQVFQNLVQNALVHREVGHPPHVHVSARDDGGAWVFEVTDDGPGIPEAYRERVFDVFQRLEGTTERGGTGMGLAIVRKAVDLHGGKVWLSSREGKGTTFYVRLPKTHGKGGGGMGGKGVTGGTDANPARG